jgi:signal transduction histidine kinase
MRRWSLRNQLFVVGALTAVVPLLVLLSVMYTTTTSEAVRIGPDGQERVIAGTRANHLPLEVVAAAVLLGAVALAVVWRWSGRATSPMRHITRVADEIQAGSLDRRIALTGQAAETQALADSFDAMLDRLEQSTTIQQRLVEDVSHELRTPLAALAINNEIALNNPEATIDDYRAAAHRSEALIARLAFTVDELLAEARSKAEATGQVDNDLMAIVNRAVDQQRLLRPDQPIEVTGPHALRLGIDGPSVQRALTNLLDNATRYAPADTPIQIEVTEDPPRLSVTDHGPGIPATDQAQIFDRYHSGETGAGIGLTLVKQVADAHGTIEVTSPPPGLHHGTRFTITFR